MARTYKRRSYRRRRRSKKLATKQYVKKLVAKEAETKIHDIIDNVNSLDWNGTIIRLSGITQGLAVDERDGDKCIMRSFNYRLYLTVGDTSNMIRVIIFQWYPNSSLRVPQHGDLLSVAAGTSESWMSQYKFNTSNQYYIISDNTYTLDALQNTVLYVRRKLKMKYVKKTIYFAEGAVDGSNHLYMLLISDSGAVAHPTWSLNGRLYFDDS